jgi:hypothetical protein
MRKLSVRTLTVIEDILNNWTSTRKSFNATDVAAEARDRIGDNTAAPDDVVRYVVDESMHEWIVTGALSDYSLCRSDVDVADNLSTYVSSKRSNNLYN